MNSLTLAAAALLAAPAVAGSLRIYDRDGLPIQEIRAEDSSFRYPVPLERVSTWVVLSTLAAEDRRFFEHRGVDWRAVLRAAWQDARAGKVVSGASTLTQQLVRVRDGAPRGWTTKFREAVAAIGLERRMGKRAILEEYLNAAPYGNGAAGIEAASRLYFDKAASELSLAESAYLSAVPQAPSLRNPLRGVAGLRRRQREILGRMRRWGWIAPDVYALALAEPVRVRPHDRRFPAPHLADRVRRWAQTRGVETASVRTTLDSGLQADIASLLKSHLRGLQANRVTNGAVLVLDNRTGEVLAWVGSRDFFDEAQGGQVDGVLSPRQPGSTLKPFVYGLALSGGRTPADILLDVPTQTADRFSPRNYDEKFHGPVRLREALACSYNVPAIRVAEELGAGPVLDILHQAGFDSLTRPAEFYGLGVALGDGEVTLLELTRAYAGLAAGGIWRRERFVLEADGRPAGVPEEPPKRFLSPEAAYLVAHILSDNAARVPAFGVYSPFNVPFAMAAKTGTSKDYRDNWAVAYTPEWTIGVWVGNFDGSPMARVSGITGAAPLLRDAALRLWQRRGASPFKRPVGIEEAEVCPVSGRLAGPHCSTTIHEVFMKGRVPRTICDVHSAPRERITATIKDGAAERPYVVFPRAQDIFKLDPSYPQEAQKLRFKAEGLERAEAVRWSVDGRAAGAAEPDGSAWWDPAPGRHHIEVEALRAGAWRRSPPVSILVVRPTRL